MILVSVITFISASFVIDDPKAIVANIDTLVFCSGKFYYEMSEKAAEMGVDNMAFVRLEQIYPLPKTQIRLGTMTGRRGSHRVHREMSQVSRQEQASWLLLRLGQYQRFLLTQPLQPI